MKQSPSPISIHTRRAFAVVAILTLSLEAQAVTRRVDINSPTNGPGNLPNWSNAYHYLQDVLNDPNLAPGDEIRLAGNQTYYPDRDSANPTGTGDVNARFSIVGKNLVIKGGYPGYNTATPDVQNPDLFASTILSGDLLNNDDPDVPSSYYDNSGPLLIIQPSPNGSSEVTNATIIDGLTFTSAVHYFGGAIECVGSSPQVRRCLIKDNIAAGGAGIGIQHYTNFSFPNLRVLSNPIIADCTFLRNKAAVNGGGIFVTQESRPFIANCFTKCVQALREAGLIT